MPRTRIARLVAAATIAAATAAPPANAVAPPPVDRALLPAPAPAAPPHPTVQRAVCTVGSLGPGGTPAQLDGLDLAAVWALSRGAGQRVAVIDTGVAAHRRLPGLVGGGDYVSTGDGTRDCDGHGTLVAGIVAAAPDPATDRFSGVAPLATVIGIRASSARFATPGNAPGIGDVDTLAKAVRTAADLGASVINISAVACRPASSGLDDRALGAALAYAVEVKNSVVVAAAGNTDEGCGTEEPMIVTPPWYDDYVLTVGSVDTRGAASAFTLPSPWVDVAAPGEAVLSLSTVGDAMADTLDGSALRGTSYAAPVVSGLAALIRSRFPDWTPRQVMDRIKATAHHPPGGRDDVVGAGVVDPLAALTFEMAREPSRPAAPPPSPDPVDLEPTAEASPAGLRTAITGTAALLALLLAAVTGRALSGRKPRRDPAALDPD
ncbi:type VII secretion-associated serine protease mycosin [Mycolicibacter heraklionensis]|uniref:Type VII secretion-associated serine protease mycosin n=1 Tax=Mycolicibacter heraklionensis TaxID=512402 RepID=A0A9X7WEU9_9MYCO|nr:type VII secretion-associated serine protease mycosin [Mycolicibacter heraklionensis]QZA06943.1 type VII secretion-associated serine protease mycosin [Mycolicibacter heraklionensis]